MKSPILKLVDYGLPPGVSTEIVTRNCQESAVRIAACLESMRKLDERLIAACGLVARLEKTVVEKTKRGLPGI